MTTPSNEGWVLLPPLAVQLVLEAKRIAFDSRTTPIDYEALLAELPRDTAEEKLTYGAIAVLAALPPAPPGVVT